MSLYHFHVIAMGEFGMLGGVERTKHLPFGIGGTDVGELVSHRLTVRDVFLKRPPPRFDGGRVGVVRILRFMSLTELDLA